jgi:hypothetical protein
VGRVVRLLCGVHGLLCDPKRFMGSDAFRVSRKSFVASLLDPSNPDLLFRRVAFLRLFSGFPSGSVSLPGLHGKRRETQPLLELERFVFDHDDQLLGVGLRLVHPNPVLDRLRVGFRVFDFSGRCPTPLALRHVASILGCLDCLNHK